MEITPTLIQLSPEERRIIEAYKAENGLSELRGTSAAVRQIIRDWQRMKSAEQSQPRRKASAS